MGWNGELQIVLGRCRVRQSINGGPGLDAMCNISLSLSLPPFSKSLHFFQLCFFEIDVVRYICRVIECYELWGRKAPFSKLKSYQIQIKSLPAVPQTWKLFTLYHFQFPCADEKTTFRFFFPPLVPIPFAPFLSRSNFRYCLWYNTMVLGGINYAKPSRDFYTNQGIRSIRFSDFAYYYLF